MTNRLLRQSASRNQGWLREDSTWSRARHQQQASSNAGGDSHIEHPGIGCVADAAADDAVPLLGRGPNPKQPRASNLDVGEAGWTCTT